MSEYHLLQDYLEMPVFAANEWSSGHRAADVFGVVLVVRQNKGELIKLLDLLTLRLRRFMLIRKLQRAGFEMLTSYLAYAQLDAPVLLFQSRSAAALYAERYVLPIIPAGTAGKIKYAVALLAGAHFSAAGEVLVFRDKQ